ncbi:hypothetical protein PSHT_13970, partial [Puccinia striiformis]
MPRLTPNHTQSTYLAILLTFHRSEYCLLPTWVAKTFRQFQKRQHAAEAANVAVKQAANKAKQQDLGLVRFIGELDKLNMFTERIIHKCIKKLRSNIDAPEEEDIESLSRLMMTVGGLLDHEKAISHMNIYFSRMLTMPKSPNLSS